MARLNIYLPDDIAEDAKSAGLNISGLTRDAILDALAGRRLDDWLDDVLSLPSLGIGPEAVAEAVAAAKDEVAGRA